MARFEELLALLCLALVLGVELLLARVGLDAIDEGYFVEQAARVLRGEVPYRDFDSLYTPGLLSLHAAMFWLVGEVHVIEPRLIGWLARVVLAVGLYVLARPLVRPAFAVLPPLCILLGFDLVPLTWEPHPGWPSAALTIVAALVFMRLPGLSDSRRRYALVAAGALAAVVFAFKQNAGVFLLCAMVAGAAWQGTSQPPSPPTRWLRVVQLALVLGMVLAATALILPSRSALNVVYFVSPLAAAGCVAIGPESISPNGRTVRQWFVTVGLLGVGFVIVTLPWVIALLIAVDGRIELLKGFVGSVDQSLLYYPLSGPPDGSWAALLGTAIAALLALSVPHRPRLRITAMIACAACAAGALLLTAEPGESLARALLETPSRSAVGLGVFLPVLCILAGAWQSLHAPATLASWRMRWLTAAGAITFLTEYPRIDAVHLAWSAGLPLVTGAIVLGQVHRALSEPAHLHRLGRVALYAALVAVPVAVVLPAVESRTHALVQLELAPPLPAVHGLLVTADENDTVLAAARFVQAVTQPGEAIFVYPSSPLLYVLADRPNPTRFEHLYPGAASAEQLQQIIGTLSRMPVRVVVVSGADLAFWGPPASNQPLEAYLATAYHEVARFGGYRVLMRG